MSETTRVPYRGLITASAMLAMFMQTLDSTIANVALPYMQGSMSASYDEITWVLTSYVIAAAIMTAPVGWMAVRFGRKRLFIICIIGFTAASMLCGAAQSLEQLVGFRLLQGMFGAALAPLSQATMLDIYPFSQRAQAMAIFSMGVTMGPMVGPTLGGYLTDLYSWRWVFYVNLPFGILALIGIMLFMRETPARPQLTFSWYGFAMLGLAAGAFQMMLDRGQELDWFSSREIMIEAVIAGLAFYLFVVHMFTAEKPFLPPGLFKDRNFASAIIMIFCVSSLMLSTSALLAPYLQNLAGYPVYTAGWVMAPRGIGIIASMFLAARMGMRVDQRKIMAFGLITLGWVLYTMSSWTPDVTAGEMMLTMIVQGFSVGLVFNPMTVMAYTTLPAVAARRGDLDAVAGAQHRLRDRHLDHLVQPDAQRAGHARRHRRGHHAVRPRAAGQRRGVAHAEPGDAARRGAARPDDQPPGADHRLQQRLSADDADHRPAAAAAVPDAQARTAGDGGGGLK